MVIRSRSSASTSIYYPASIFSVSRPQGKQTKQVKAKVKDLPEFLELDPTACQTDMEMMRILHEALDLYKTTFLVPGNQEQPIERIATHFFNRNDKILVNLKKLPNRDKCGVAAVAIICMLKDNSTVCHLDYLAVNPEYRGGGIGSIFMTKFVIPTICQQYQRNITLECEGRLINWYCKLGAKKIDQLSESMLGDNKTLYSLLCFFRDDKDCNMELATAQSILTEIRNSFHGMGKLDIVEVTTTTPTSDNQQQDEEKKKTVYRWSRST